MRLRLFLAMPNRWLHAITVKTFLLNHQEENVNLLKEVLSKLKLENDNIYLMFILFYLILFNNTSFMLYLICYYFNIKKKDLLKSKKKWLQKISSMN